jgi:hypothetical protein
MPVIKKIYNAVGIRIKIITGNKIIIHLLDNYFDSAIGKRNIPGSFNATIYYQSNCLTGQQTAETKRTIRFKNSIINLPKRIIHSYCPKIPASEQTAILLEPLWQLLTRLGYYSLHGALIKSTNRLIAFFGPSGSGKSTLSSASLKHGFSLACDDFFFIKSVGKNIKIIPFAKKVKVKNIRKKTFLNLNDIRINSRKAYFLAKKMVIIFPRYSAKKKARLHSISKKYGILEVLKDNLALKIEGMNKKDYVEISDLIFQIGEKTSFYELTYHDCDVPMEMFERLFNADNNLNPENQ